MRWLVIAIVLSVSAWADGGEGETHRFTDVFGQKIEATIVKVEGGQVFLEEKGGTTLSLSLKSLPKAEQQVVRDWLKTGQKP